MHHPPYARIISAIPHAISGAIYPHASRRMAALRLLEARSIVAIVALVIALYLPPTLRLLGAATVPCLRCSSCYLAPATRNHLRLYVVGMARARRCGCATMPHRVRNACAFGCALPAHVMRATRAVIVAIGCECGAILAPMYPPMLHQTRAIAASSMRRLGAVSDSTPAAAGGAS